MAKEKKNIIIIGAGSKISREIFKNKNQFNIVGFSRFSKAKDVKEYKVENFKGTKSIKKFLDKKKYKKIILIFMEAESNSKIIINKNSSEILREMKSNFINFHDIVKIALPHMLKQKWGRIIFCGSSGALKTDIGSAGYSASKYALLGYCKTLSKEYARYGVNSNYLSLGLFNTSLFTKLNKKTKDNLLNNTDTKSIGDFKSIFNAINFLINSNYVTGSIIPIDGGFN